MPGRHTVARRPRSFASIVSIAAFLAAVVPWGLATPAQAAGVPANFFTINDTGGANDAVGQGDLTQFGRDDSDPNTYLLEWGWDNIVWPGNNTGDACALFDKNGNGGIDFAVCVEIGADGAKVVQKGGSPTTWNCNDSKNDRCAGPSQVTPTIATVGDLATFAASPPADLVTSTDPFAAGTDSPKDTTVQVRIPKNKLPLGAELTNVCSYPSIGSGGNTDPKDCVANPGGGFLVIHKNAGNDTTTTFNFTLNPGNTTVPVVGTGNSTPQSVIIGSGYSIAETVPAGWLFDSASCTLEGGGATGTPGGTGVTNITVESGKITTCNVVDELQNPHITIVKQADKGSVPAVGQNINYTLTATNDGNVPLTNVHIDDTLIANANLTCLPVRGSTLNPTQTMTCTGSHTVTQADVDSGHVNNTGTATGTPSSGPNVTDTDSVNLAATRTAALSLTKTADTGAADPSKYDHVGQSVTYTLTATNTGNVTLTGVGITDPIFNSGNTITTNCTKSGVVGNVTPPVTLAPGESLQCQPTYSIIQADLDNGHKDNTATGHATGPSGAVPEPTASATITAAGAPNFSITKSADTGGANKSVYDHVNQDVTYTLTLTNNGNQTLSAVSISDPKLGALNCAPAQPVASLAVGSSLVCTGHYLITQADLDSGSVHNTATGHASGPAGALGDKTAQATVTAAQTKSIDLVKTAVQKTYNKVGDVIDYTLVATNNGNVTLDNVTVVDPTLGTLTCVPNNSPLTLAPGDHVDCTGSFTITQKEMDAGQLVNVATASGDPRGGGAPATDTDTATVSTNQAPAIDITKTPDVLTYSAVGDVIHYTIVATNTGNVTLSNVDVTDGKVSNLVCVPATPVATLAPTDHIDCTASHTVTQADLNATSYDNTAHAEGAPPVGRHVSDDALAQVFSNQTPGLSVVKVASPTVFSGVGQSITYTVTATNTGNVTLSNFAISDPLLGGMMTSCTDGGVGVLVPPVASFAPGAVMVCTASYQTTAQDVQNGGVANTATGAGMDPAGAPVSATGSANVGFQAPPPPPVANLGITKSSVPASGSFVQPGDQIVYTLSYTNTGNGAGSLVVVSDVLPADLDYVAGSASNGSTYDAAARTLTWNIGNVAPGGGGTVSFTGQVASTATNGEVLSNVGVLTAPGVSLPSNPDDVTVTVPTGALTLTKAVNHKSAEFGDTLTYSVLVGATGGIDQTNVVVTDSVPDGTTYVDGSATCDAPCTASESGGVVTWTIGTLAKGTSTTVSFKVTVDTPAAADDGSIPATRIRNVAVGSSDSDPGVVSNKVITDITAVLGVTHHRKPHVKPEHHERLPFTGLPYSLAQLLTMAGVAVGAGTLLVHRARTRRALAEAIETPRDE